ncbi:hypothetical protein [Sediminibacterium soli]|uniref:hypothetical protein n=1 Tax=Sediminibacterium soli TaxID=2698829 RepID=UPI00137B0AD4|nr:hypothetical protein [Sediminibacterium soli]NCI46221.1 hypothetical protein [Sediminibacterium soli]
MENVNIPIVVIVVIIALAIVLFVTIRNQKDRKKMNPDAPDSMEETKTDDMNDRQHL